MGRTVCSACDSEKTRLITDRVIEVLKDEEASVVQSITVATFLFKRVLDCERDPLKKSMLRTTMLNLIANPKIAETGVS